MSTDFGVPIRTEPEPQLHRVLTAAKSLHSVSLTALSCFTSSAGAESSPIHTKLSGTYISKVFKRPPTLTPTLGLSSRHCGDLGSLCCGDMWVCEDSQGADTGSSLPSPGQRQAEPVLTRLANRFSCCSGTPIIAVAQFL